MPGEFTPQDKSQRDLIRESLDETLFVEAGAGTGKTTSLVDRVVKLVSSGTTTLDRIAAITFTNAAAAELRDRVREALESADSDTSLSDEERERCSRGVQDLDQASIQTLHSFASSILMERPLEAGLPPSFEVMDEIAGDIDFDAAWSSWIDNALEGDIPLPTLPMALSLGLSPAHLRDIALKFHANHDLLAEATFDDTPMPPSEATAALVQASGELDRLCGYSDLRESDRLFGHVQGKLGTIRRLPDVEPGSATAYRMLSRTLPLRQSRGRQGDWSIEPNTGQNACKRLKDMLDDLHAQVEDELSEVRGSALASLLRALKTFVLEYADDRKRRGRAGFHDQLVWARDLLRDNIEVRDHFRGRFSHLLIDEAQDTDPLQAEIAMFLAESTPSTDDGRATQWDHIVPERGKIFVVGDPKQSIYRFRRADVRQMERLRERMGGNSVQLVQSFRSQRPIIEWVNNLFREWMSQSDDQTTYASIVHRWEASKDRDAGPGVWYIGDVMEGVIEPIRRAEAGDIARLLAAIGGGKMRVLDREATETSGVEKYRPATYSDVCILMPRRIGLRILEIALEDANIPYRLEGASLVFETQEVRDLLNCLRAIDDPSDQVAIVAALRSPAFACSDVDLMEFYEVGGRFDYLSGGGTSDGPVSEALDSLEEYHKSRLWTSAVYLIDRFIRDRHLMEAALDHPRTREQWRRYRFIVEQARVFAEAGGTSLRGFLDWMSRQAEEGARVTETPVPEGDEEAVRIMTIHGSKGLEFPVVVLTGLNSSDGSRSESVIFDRDSGRMEVRAGDSRQSFTTSGYEDAAEFEKKMQDAEAVRLLYVAATRARDHLVVSVYRSERGASPASTIAGLLEGRDDLWRPLADLSDLDPLSSYPAAEPDEVDPGRHSLEARRQWIEYRKRLIERQGRPASVAATWLANAEKEEPETEEPWRRGRAGTSVGRAVHAVLQTIDLATGDGIDETVRAQAAAEGIPQRQREVARLTRVAIESEVVKRAVASGRFWREVPFGVPVGDGALEGFVDLLFEENDGLVIVDYKTDSVGPEEVANAANRYRLQAGSYALLTQRATRKPVKEIVFLFLQPNESAILTNVSELTMEAETAAVESLTSA